MRSVAKKVKQAAESVYLPSFPTARHLIHTLAATAPHNVALLRFLSIQASDDYLMVFENFSTFYTFDQEFTEEEKRILAAQWCNGQVGMGESSQSSSPLDPTFWSMHPTMERLLV